ncbi:alpha/beta hydrolase [Comamonadaceae bacterium M7527]|nr:alpha/beta hydrolase [Comamonadaceae bacterium M7527]
MYTPEAKALATPDGQRLVSFAWPWRRDDAPRAHVLLVHGLGEHARRYDTLAMWFQNKGISVWAYDQRGHGVSSGARATLPTPDALLYDLDVVWQAFANAHNSGVPLLVLGHSMGGLVVMRWLQRDTMLQQTTRPAAAIVSSPALGVYANGVEQWLVRTLARYVPNVRLGNGLKLQGLSHDPAVIQAYKQDPLVHKYVTPRLVQWIVANGAHVVGSAAQWSLPSLLMYAGADALVNPKAADAFAKAAPACVQTHRLDAAFHEIFNESAQYRDQALATLQQWLDGLLGKSAA